MLQDTLFAQIAGFDVMMQLRTLVDNAPFGKRCMVAYRVITPTGVEFNGDQFSPSPIHNWDSWQAICKLLFWICVTPESGSDLSDYSAAQLAWANSSECEIASSIFWEEELLRGDLIEIEEEEIAGAIWRMAQIEYGIEEEAISILLRTLYDYAPALWLEEAIA